MYVRRRWKGIHKNTKDTESNNSDAITNKHNTEWEERAGEEIPTPFESQSSNTLFSDLIRNYICM